MSQNPDHWHIARCKPGQDDFAAHQLGLRKYPVFRPTMPGFRRTRWGHQVPEAKSMFPGYLFVQPGPYGWQMLRYTPGIIHGDSVLMTKDNRLVSLDEDDLQIIREGMKQKWADHFGKPKSPYRPGDRVRIEAGQWVDFFATIERVDKSLRIAVLIDLLGRKVRVYPKVEHLSLV